MNSGKNIDEILDVAVTMRKADKIGIAFLLANDAETGRHVIRELIAAPSSAEENGLFQQFLMQTHLANASEFFDTFVEACVVIQNFRVCRALGYTKDQMQKLNGKVNSYKKSLYLLADSLSDENMKCLIAKLDDGNNNGSDYLEEVFLDWQLRGVISTGPQLDSSVLEKLKDCLKMEPEPLSSDEEFYKITDKNNLGYCIIINNADFTQNHDLKELMPAQRLPPRNGSDRDAECLHEIFTMLKFNVKIHKNLPYTELKALLSSYSATIPETHSFFILVFMSHGTEDVVYTSDSVPVSVEALEMAFQRNSCPQLTGKPKILIIQACQGDNLQSVRLDGENKSATTLETLTLGPERGDALIAWSTVKGYASFRDRIEGSWFIQELCKELTENFATRDLVDIVTRVNNRLRSKTHFGMFMVPSLSTSLCKKIKFI